MFTETLKEWNGIGGGLAKDWLRVVTTCKFTRLPSKGRFLRWVGADQCGLGQVPMSQW